MTLTTVFNVSAVKRKLWCNVISKRKMAKSIFQIYIQLDHKRPRYMICQKRTKQTYHYNQGCGFRVTRDAFKNLGSQ